PSSRSRRRIARIAARDPRRVDPPARDPTASTILLDERAWLLSKRREQGYGGRCTLGGTQRSGAQRAGVGRRGATIAWSAGAFLGSLAAQTLAQARMRPRELRLGEARRPPQQSCDLLMRVAFDIVQPHDGARQCGQLRER